MKIRLSKTIDIMNKVIITVLLLLSLFSIINSFFLFHSIKNPTLIHYFEIHHTIRRLLSFVMLIVVWKLYKRVSAAWTITMLALSAVIFQYLMVHHYHVFHISFLLTLTVFIILLLSKNYYCRKCDAYSLKKGFMAYLIFVVFVFFNAVIGFYHIRIIHMNYVPFFVSIRQTIEVMLNMDNMNLLFTQNNLYHRFVFWFSWINIILGLVMILTPYINDRLQTLDEPEKTRELVKKYGQNCSSYLTLEKGKTYYFGKSVEGFVAYGIVKDVAVVLGEPICDAKDFSVLLSEFKNFCQQNAYSILILNATSMFIKEYKHLGMGYVKCGEEPRFDLKKYSLAGGSASKIRLNINHATKAGLTVLEYEPLKKKNLSLEKEILEVSQEWLTMKKSSELVFTLGGIGFNNPMDRRYFYAINSDHVIEGFIVFLPFAGMKGYMADVTRHRRNATRGVMEKIFYDSMMKFKEEGYEWGSTAVAPLARLEEEPAVTAKFLNIIYEKMNGVYGFKTLYQTKLKYNPTYWEPSYYVYYPSVFTPAMAYAIIRIQNPRGVKDYAKAFLRNFRKEKSVAKKQLPIEDNREEKKAG